MSSQVKIVIIVLFLALCATGYLYNENLAISTNIAYTQRVSISLSAQESGKVVNMPVREGEIILSGFEIAKIDSTMWELKRQDLAQQSQREALKQAQLEEEYWALSREYHLLDSHIVSLADFVKQTQVRLKQLEESGVKGIDTQIHDVRAVLYAQQSEVFKLLRERDALQSAKMRSKAQLAQVSQHLEMLASDHLSHEALRSRFEVISPVRGQVSRVEIYAGDSVNAGQSIVTLVSMEEPAYLIAYFDETHLPKLQVGKKVHIHLDSAPGVLHHGVIYAISPLAGASVSGHYPNYSSGSFTRIGQKVPVRIAFSTPYYDFPAGLSATVRLIE